MLSGGGYQPHEAAPMMHNQGGPQDYNNQGYPPDNQGYGGGGPGGYGGGPGGGMMGGPGMGGQGGQMAGPGGGYNQPQTMPGGQPGPGGGYGQGGGMQQGNMQASPAYQGAPKRVTGMNENIWFFTACCVMLTALFCFFAEIAEGFQLIDMFESIFLLLMGSALAIVDTPFCPQVQRVRILQDGVRQYAAVMERVTGKGIVLLFLGCSLWAAVWSNLPTGAVMVLTGFLSFVVIFVGIGTIGLGVKYSYKFDKVRKNIRKDNRQDQSWSRVVKNDRNGMNIEELGLLGNEFGVPLTEIEKQAAMYAISKDRKRERISKEAYYEWLNPEGGGWVVL